MPQTIVLDFDVPEERPESEVSNIAFKINGQVFPISTPKLGIATAFVDLMENSSLSQIEFATKAMNAIRAFIVYFQEVPGYEPGEIDGQPNPNAGKLRGRARIMQRLNDPADSFDLMDLAEPLKQAFGTMFGGRPTSPSPGSSERRPDDGTESPEASSPAPAATSGPSPRKRSSQQSKKR